LYQSIRYTSPQLRALYVLAAVVVALCHLAIDLGARASVHRPVLTAFIVRSARTSACFAIGFARGLITPEAAEPTPPRDCYDLEPVAPFVPALGELNFDLHIADDVMVDAFLASTPDSVLEAFFASIPDEPVPTPDVPFNLKALRAECARLGLPTYGTKAQLAERLAAPF